MTVFVNDKEITFPSSLADITLGQRIDFHTKHEVHLNEMAKVINDIKDPEEKHVEFVNFIYERLIRSVAYFGDISLKALRSGEFMHTVNHIYEAALEPILFSIPEIEPLRSFMWNDEEWVLQDPELSQGSTITFGELIDGKQMIKDLSSVQAGHWECMLPICAIYLRKKGEKYSEQFLYEESDRLKLMRTLPMDIAVHVGFFLTSIINSSTTISMSFANQGLKDRENTHGSISSGTAGSTFLSLLPPQKYLIYQGVVTTASSVQEHQNCLTY